MIIPMKRAQIIALKAEKDSLLLALQRCGEVMIINPDDSENIQQTESADINVQQTETTLKFLKNYQQKSSFFEDRPIVDYNDFITKNYDGEALNCNLSKLSDKLNQHNSEINNLLAQNDLLKPWDGLDFPIEALDGTKNATFITGFIPTNAKSDIVDAVNTSGGDLSIFGNTPDGLASLIVVFSNDAPTLHNQIKEIGFLDGAPPHANGTPASVIYQNEKKISDHRSIINQIENEIQELAQKKDKIELLFDQYEAEKARRQVGYEQTVDTIILEAWVRSDRLDFIEDVVKAVTDVYSLEFFDPTDEDQPPTVTKNNKFISQFETITDMFSKPKQGSIDPAPIAGPWYWIIFGMMMGDVGYGAVMFILFYSFKKIKKPKGDFARLINVLFYSSIPTIFFGVLFGSYFGETWHPLLFAPLDNPIYMLIFTLIIGVLHIFSGMGLKIAENIKQGKVLDAIFDQVSWMVLITGLGFLFLPTLKTVGQWMAILGALVILCTAGREKKGIVGKITGGLLGLYDISSYMSDILSYSRILALSLATGVIGMVMNLLAHMVSGSIIGFVFAILIYLVGHSFNLAMSLLSAYVHDSRLQYIEFFNKFYEGGGRAFIPLSINAKHIDIIDDMDKKEL